MATRRSREASLTLSLSKLQEKVRLFRDRSLGEQNTKTSLIEPVLAALGWNIQDPDEVDQEFKANRRDNPVDYALLLNGRPRMLVEAKGLGQRLDDRRWISQVLGYAVTAGVEWCVLTDGNQFCFFKATAPVDAQEKLFCKFVLSTDSLERCVELSSLIARDELENNKLESYWFTHHVRRQIRVALEQLLRTADPTLVRLVKKRAKGVTSQEISDALRRLDIKIEAGTEHFTKRKAIRTAKRSGTGASLNEVVQSTQLQLPLDLIGSYHGTRIQASLLASGMMRVGDQEYANPTAAGIDAIRHLSGKKVSINGWKFWKLRNAEGNLVQLGTLRSKPSI